MYNSFNENQNANPKKTSLNIDNLLDSDDEEEHKEEFDQNSEYIASTKKYIDLKAGLQSKIISMAPAKESSFREPSLKTPDFGSNPNPATFLKRRFCKAKPSF